MSDTGTDDDYLGGVDYPASPQVLIDAALGNRAPQGFLDILRSLPQTDLESADAAADAIARAQPAD